MTALTTTLQAFFTDRLIRQRQASPHTCAAYRDSLRLMLTFASARHGTEPSKLDFDHLDAPLIGDFLDHIERQRKNAIRTRNTRLAAIRSLFRFAALRHPEHAALIERVLAIPPKRFERRLVTFLTEQELEALLAAPARSTWTGRRDHALLRLAAQTGLRASELIGLRRADLYLGSGAHVSCLGKGRKARITPLTSGMVAILRDWLAERAGQPEDPLYPTRDGKTMSRDALASACHIRRDRWPRLSVTESEERHHARPEAHRGNAIAASRRRHFGDRALAWSRTNRNNPGLRARRSGTQGARLGENCPGKHETRALPPARQASCLPGGNLIMPTSSSRSPPPRPTSTYTSA